MNLKLYKTKLIIKRKLADFWYWLMKPIAYFFTKDKINKRYEKKVAKITEGQAVKWIAEDIAKYALKYRRSGVAIMICDRANDDYFWSDCCLSVAPYYIKRDNARMAFYKFDRTIEFQEKIMNKLKEFNEIAVKETIEDLGYRKQFVQNYKKTVVIKAKQ